MSAVSTFGTFTMARLGIFAAQHALNVTGNNITNINTEGYTRQKLDQVSMYYGAADRYNSVLDIRSNGGALATGVDQMRDQYLDIRYRNEMTRVGEMDSKLDGLTQLSTILDEVGKGEDGEGVLEARFNDLMQQIQVLSQPQNSELDDIDKIVRSSAESLTAQFRSYAAQLTALAETQAQQFKDTIKSVNEKLTEIRDLNESIRKNQLFGSESLAQKDERNVLIDELSEKIGIHVIYETEKVDEREVEKLKITTAGEPERVLIDGVYGSQISLLNETNYDLGITQLKDGKGRGEYFPDTATEPGPLEGVREQKDASLFPDPDELADRAAEAKSNAVAASLKTADTAAKAKAQAIADRLNSDASYYKISTTDDEETTTSKLYYFGVSEQTGANGETNYRVVRYATDSENDADTPEGRAARKDGVFPGSVKSLKIELNDDGTVKSASPAEKASEITWYPTAEERAAANAAAAAAGDSAASAVKTASYGAAALAEAQKLADKLNSDPVYFLHEDPVKAYYYEVEQKPAESGDEGISYVLRRYETVYSTDDAIRANRDNLKNPGGQAEYINITEPVTKLTDTELRGGLQAMREMLTEQGEYADSLHLAIDEEAGTKRGIPYYQKTLDTLARTFANAMNKANTLTDDILYEHTYLTNDKGNYVDKYGVETSDPKEYVPVYIDKNGNELVDSEGNPVYDKKQYVVRDEYKKYFKRDTQGRFLDAQGNVLENQDDPRHYVHSPDYEELFGGNLFSVSGESDVAGGSGETAALEQARILNNTKYSDGTKQYYYDVVGGYNSDGQMNYWIKRYETSSDATSLDAREAGINAAAGEYIDAYTGLPVASREDATSYSDDKDPYQEITAANFYVSYSWSHNRLQVLRSVDPDADIKSNAQDNIAHIISLFGDRHKFEFGAASKGTTYFKGTFQEMLTDSIAGTLAKDQNMTDAMLDNYNITADELYLNRDAVMGVDLNDEAMNMMQFQKAYSAACRLMTTFDDMLDRLINGTAV